MKIIIIYYIIYYITLCDSSQLDMAGKGDIAYRALEIGLIGY